MCSLYIYSQITQFLLDVSYVVTERILCDEAMEVSNGVSVVKLLFQPVKNKLSYFIFTAFNPVNHSPPSSMQPGSLGMIQRNTIC